MLEGVDRPDLLGEAMLRLAMMYRRVGQLDESVTLCMQAMEIARDTDDPWALIFAYQGLGISYQQSERYAEAHNHYSKMHELARLLPVNSWRRMRSPAWPPHSITLATCVRPNP